MPGDAVGFGGSADEDQTEGPGFGGSGSAGEGLDLAEENEKLRLELQQVRSQLQTANEIALQSQATFEEFKTNTETRESERDAAARDFARRSQARASALESAHNRLSVLQPDVLHDSSAYEGQLNAALDDIERAAELQPDEATMSARENAKEARDAYENRDMDRMYFYAQNAMLELQRTGGLR